MNAYTTAYIINNFFYAYVLYRICLLYTSPGLADSYRKIVSRQTICHQQIIKNRPISGGVHFVMGKQDYKLVFQLSYKGLAAKQMCIRDRSFAVRTKSP